MKYRKAKRFDKPIKPLTYEKLPTRFMFFDTETQPELLDSGQEIQHLKLGVCKLIIRDKLQKIKKEETLVFYTALEFFEFLEDNLEKKQKLTVFAHNIAFDLMVVNIFDYFNKQNIKMRPPIQSGMRFLWKVNHPKGTVEFINVGNYVPFPLSVIGKDLGFDKLDIDFETTSNEDLITYCIRDVEIIQKFIFEFISFLKSNNLGGFKSTIASQALSVYRHSFMDEEITLHSNLSINTIERDSYLGGRTECFFIGDVPEDKIYGLDINSMYPYVMKQGFLPSMYRGSTRENNHKLIRQIMKNNYVICDVQLNTNIPFHGVKWSKNRFNVSTPNTEIRGVKLLFPIGNFRTYLHHDEMQYALDHDLIDHVYNIYLYKPADLFSSYVDFFTNIKVKATIEGNRTNRLMAKLFLNSLYGKFGQLFHDMDIIAKNVRSDFKIMNVINMNTGLKYTDFQWFNDLWREYTNGESAYSFPAIAGAITARSRMLLWSYIEKIGLENVYYCDTDSVYTNEHGYTKLLPEIHDTKLGAMALEAELTKMTIFGAKDYKKEGERVVKGVPKSAIWLNESVSISTRFEGWKEYRNNGMDRPPLTWSQLKIKQLPYDKGIVTETGHVKPYYLTDKKSI